LLFPTVESGRIIAASPSVEQRMPSGFAEVRVCAVTYGCAGLPLERVAANMAQPNLAGLPLHGVKTRVAPNGSLLADGLLRLQYSGRRESAGHGAGERSGAGGRTVRRCPA